MSKSLKNFITIDVRAAGYAFVMSSYSPVGNSTKIHRAPASTCFLVTAVECEDRFLGVSNDGRSEEHRNGF